MIPRDFPTYEEARERWLRLQSEADAAHAEMLDALYRRQQNGNGADKMATTKALLTIPEAADMMGVSRPTVYKLSVESRGMLPMVKLGSGTRLRTRDVLAYIEQL